MLEAHVWAELRKQFVRIQPGDTVTIEVSRHDPARARILDRA